MSDKVKVIVSDNASSDNTESVLLPYRGQISYIKQQVNLGADGNFAYLLDNSFSKYKWIFGSDDILLEGALLPIVSFLENVSGLGLLHIKGKGRIEPSLDETAIIGNVRLESSKTRFVEDISNMMAFITANIFNSELLPSGYCSTQGAGSNLMQLYPYLYAIESSNVNAIFSGKFYVAQTMNYSGGYKQLQVFGPNLWQIFHFFSERGFPLNDFCVVGSSMCVQYYPHYIACRRTARYATLIPDEKAFSVLISIYKFNLWFWLASAPIFILGPKGLFISRTVSLLYKAYRLVVRLFAKCIIFGRSRSFCWQIRRRHN